jgi:hypothetical protein
MAFGQTRALLLFCGRFEVIANARNIAVSHVLQRKVDRNVYRLPALNPGDGKILGRGPIGYPKAYIKAKTPLY